jgi:hypothetical protein
MLKPQAKIFDYVCKYYHFWSLLSLNEPYGL